VVALDRIDNAREPRHRVLADAIAALAPAPVIAPWQRHRDLGGAA
jgi:hypothetical protein